MEGKHTGPAEFGDQNSGNMYPTRYLVRGQQLGSCRKWKAGFRFVVLLDRCGEGQHSKGQTPESFRFLEKCIR